MSLKRYLLVSLFLSTAATASELCRSLNAHFSNFDPLRPDLLHSRTVRYVSSKENATDTSSCLCRLNPCATPQYALQGDDEEPPYNITLIFGPGTHTLNEGLTLSNSSHITLYGVDNTVLECGADRLISDCSQLMNVRIVNSSFINIRGITFQNCRVGVPMVLIENSEHVVFDQCVFRDNPTSAVHMTQANSVAFRNCIFADNIHRQDPAPFNNQDQFPQSCYPQQKNINGIFLESGPVGGGISVFSNSQSFKLYISGCIFEHNSAQNNTRDTSQPRASTLLSQGHGGALHIQLLRLTGVEVCIEDSTFIQNTAQAEGGALQLSASESENNKFLIVNSTFTSNNCTIDKCRGGAIGIDFFQDSSLNLVHIFDSRFKNNSADAGGALAMLNSGQTSYSDEEQKTMWFRNCSFDHNMARKDGSVLSVFSVTAINTLTFPVFVENCSFRNNIALDVNRLTPAVSGFRVAINFLDTTIFHNNFGGGISVIESQVRIHDHVMFHHNFASSGGGMSLYGRCLLQVYERSSLTFSNNFALGKGGGLYVEYIRTGFIFGVLNRGCFIQYYSSTDLPPNNWVTSINFINNTAGEAGAAIYASDMSYCHWFGDTVGGDMPIFVPVENYDSPFHFMGNVLAHSDSTNITEIALATDTYRMRVKTEEYGSYSYNEQVLFRLSAIDQFNNSGEAVWQVVAPEENEFLGAISSNRTLYTYDIPSEQSLAMYNSGIPLNFSIFSVSSSIVPVNVNLSLTSCHPGYFSNSLKNCQCKAYIQEIVRCDTSYRYFYVQEGLWVHATDDNNLVFRATLPGFLNCSQEGNLQGCLFKFDRPDEQCTRGRKGVLCAECEDGYSLTLDLLRCQRNCSNIVAAVVFVVVCIVTVIVTFLALYFDFAIPNELKGFVFFAQVIGVVYQNSPYVDRNRGDAVLDFIINMFGTALPFPVCFSSFSGAGIAWLGVIPSSLALATALVYIKSAGKIKCLYKRESYGLHGFHFICLFIYKYFLDTSFAFVNVRKVYDNPSYYVSSYSGQSFTSPLILSMVIIGIISILLFAIVAPIILLIYIYRPQKHLHLANAFTRGVKNDRRYLWHGVWDIWRRLPFVAINLLISVTPVSILVLLHCLFSFFVLIIHCIFKPYEKDFINVIEAAILFCLLGATLAILDDNDIYVQRTTGVIFITVPFVYALLFIIYLIGLKLYRRKNPKFNLPEAAFTKLRSFSSFYYVQEQDTNDQDRIKETSKEMNISETLNSKSGQVELREPLLDS